VSLLERFGEAELARIREAVTRAEQRTAGELVTYLVGECDAYPEATWRAAGLGGLLGLTAAAGLHDLLGLWGGPALLWSTVPALLGAGAGALLARVPALRRALVSRRRIDRRVQLRAEAAFLEEEVFRTRDRSGILIFLALFEHRAVVLGDVGIYRVVAPAEWQGVVDALIAGIREGRPVDALVAAVETCGRLLEERGVAIRAGDLDELANQPRLREH
jgi:putative membrane protein